MKNIILTLIALLFLTFESCIGLKTEKSFNAPKAIIQFNRSDMDYLGDLEGSITYNTYLSFFNTNNRSFITIQNDTISGNFPAIEKLNVNYFGDPTLINNLTTSSIYTARLMNELAKKYPSAEIYLPIYYSHQKFSMFGGSKNTIKIKVKAYKWK